MKSLLLCAGLSGLLALPGGIGAHEPKEHASAATVTPVDPATAQVLGVVEQFGAALKAGDLDRSGALLAEDVLILESGGAETSRQEYLGDHAKHDAEFLKGARIEVKRRTARVDGGFAWVGTESELGATSNGKPLTLLSTETMVLRKTGPDWLIVHIHWSSRPKPLRPTP